MQSNRQFFSATIDFCDEFTFNGDLSNEGCSPNVLDAGRISPIVTDAVALFDAAGLADIFGCPGDFTVLFPSNDAIDALDDSILQTLLDPMNVDVLRSILAYHVLPGNFASSSLVAGSQTTLLDGFSVTIGVDPVTFDGVSPINTDFPACNGLFHVIDSILVPDINSKSIDSSEVVFASVSN